MYLWNLKLGISKGYKLEYDSRPIGDCADRRLAENSHPLPGSQTAATSTCKLGNTVIGIAKRHTAAQVDVESLHLGMHHCPSQDLLTGLLHHHGSAQQVSSACEGRADPGGKKINCSEPVCVLKCQGLLCG